MKRFCLAIVAAALLMVPLTHSVGAQQARGEIALRRAMETQTVKGDLTAAIQQYRKIVEEHKAERSVVARALLQMAECYETMGEAEAYKHYSRIVEQYADQTDLVATAKTRLARSPRSPRAGEAGPVAREIWSGADLANRLTTNAAIGFRVKPSADGQWLAFVDNPTGNVALRHVTSGEIRLLTKEARAASLVGWSDAALAFHPTLSPDGSQVAYLWGSGGGYSVRVAPVSGGRPRVLLERELYVSAIAWAPDGSALAVIAGNQRGFTDPHIALISVSNGSTTRLKSLPYRQNYNGPTPQLGGFSPDGRYLVYAVANDIAPNPGGIFAIAVDGTQEVALVRGATNESSPAWTPDGRAVIFVSDRSANHGIWSIRVANGKPAGDPELVRDNVGPIQALGFSSDGTFFYGDQSTRQDVFAAEIDTDAMAIKTPPGVLIDRSQGSNRGASWSPDGRYLAFVRSNPSGATVVIRSADGLERTMPTTFRDGGYSFAVPSWFPDSRSLLVPEIDRSTRRSTFRRIQIDTLQETVVFQGPNWEMRRVTGPSPDGKYVCYSKREETTASGSETIALVRRDLDNGTETELYRAEFAFGPAFFSPAISPDGRRVAFASFDKNRVRTLMSVSTTGGAPQEIGRGNLMPAPGDHDQTIQWTSDGRFLLVTSPEPPDLRRLVAVPSEGGAPRKLELVMANLTLTGVSPDGRRLAIVTTRTRPEIWMVKNLLKTGDRR